jgi:hypothetical protein
VIDYFPAALRRIEVEIKALSRSGVLAAAR